MPQPKAGPAPRLTLIAAMDENRVIGADGGMPWHIPDDLAWFKRQTRGKPILMGRRTYESIGRALPQRRNFVLTRDASFRAPDIERVSDVDRAVERAGAAGAEELMVIGGAQVYALTLERAHTLLITRIEARYSGDTWFPHVDWSRWELVAQVPVDAAPDVPAHRFLTFRRRGA